MARTLVGIFDDSTSAQSVIQELQRMGVQREHARLMNNNDKSTNAASDDGTDAPRWTDKVSNWFKSLVDDEGDRAHADAYAEAWRRGHFLVVADVENEQVDQVVSVMNRYGAVDVERRSAEWKSSGYDGRFNSANEPYSPAEFEQERLTYQTTTATAAEGDDRAARTQDTSIPVVQEELAIGKRIVQRGGVRIHSYVEERPVEELIRLRDERVDVQRRPVDRPAAASDMAFQDRAVEVTAKGEEAIIEKRARVVEEVTVNKQVAERDQRVAETLRRRDVRVENLPPDSAPASR